MNGSTWGSGAAPSAHTATTTETDQLQIPAEPGWCDSMHTAQGSWSEVVPACQCSLDDGRSGLAMTLIGVRENQPTRSSASFDP